MAYCAYCDHCNADILDGGNIRQVRIEKDIRLRRMAADLGISPAISVRY